MITFHASAVCRVRDSYTGRPLEGAGLLCTLDGLPVRPLSKPGGILVLLNLEPGQHRLTVRSGGYQEEWVDISAGTGTAELEITLKPGAGYPFLGEITRLGLTATVAGGPGGTGAEGGPGQGGGGMRSVPPVLQGCGGRRAHRGLSDRRR